MTCPPLSSIASKEQQEQRQQRDTYGQCQVCGQQLYRFESRKEWRLCLPKKKSSVVNATSISNLRKIPLSIPNLVDRGQCVRCLRRQNPPNPASGPEAAGSEASVVNNQSRLSHDANLTSGIAPIAPVPLNMLGPQLTTTATRTTSTKPPPLVAYYEGPYNDYGQKHGAKGTMTWANGDQYQGDFRKDERHGSGTLFFAAGGEYVGDWEHNQMHGQGTRRYPGGDVYVGEYRYGQRHGQGRFYYANGDLYWGAWQDNVMSGLGRYYYAGTTKSTSSRPQHQQCFEGTFRHGKRNGKGKVQRADQSLDIFQYINDERVGQGVRWSADRTKAWRLWIPNPNKMEKQRISVAEAVSMSYEIERAAAAHAEDIIQ